MRKNRIIPQFLVNMVVFFGIATFAVFSTQLSAAPNYYYSSIDYTEYQALGVFQEVEQVEKIEAYLQNTVSGLTVSYREVLDALVASGLQVFIKGGGIRDLLSLTASDPHDLDIVVTGTMEDLISTLNNTCWRYTHLPGGRVVYIGDHRNHPIEVFPLNGVPVAGNENFLEFTINDILYDCNAKRFFYGFEIGFEDLRHDRLNIVAKDWSQWLYRDKGWDYHKIFRFWKMVGKGYVFSTELANFFYNETMRVLRENPEKFQRNLLVYLGSHYHCFDDLYHGSVAAMGYDWAQQNVLSLREGVEKKSKDIEEKKDQYTYMPISHETYVKIKTYSFLLQNIGGFP
ncbi:MAG: hypothetical protein K940chlam7_01854 [Chlamydiae bacterium]|nr:hypothetical protein [Chlamydiota bacterium]